MKKLFPLAALLCMAAAKLSQADYFYNRTRPLVLAHRGASGQFPEHSAAAYASAYHYGADFVELDLQLTKDGYLVTNHDPTLKDTTDVESHPEFASRKGSWRFPPYDNIYDDDFLIHDFTLAELKTLRRRMRYGQRSQFFNGQF